ncbi:hypothetical protein [Microbacterium sp.]|uniref:hypothetical protein n=1 Tax=Microbacterium sp. TaxID=51671 RepID=UPI002B45B70B|nr:hypothetical protein [Microbacterium sp.]
MIALAALSALCAIITTTPRYRSVPAIVMLASMLIALATEHRADIMLVLAAAQVLLAPIAVLGRRGSASALDAHRGVGSLIMAWIFVTSVSTGTGHASPGGHVHGAGTLHDASVVGCLAFVAMSAWLAWKAARAAYGAASSADRRRHLMHALDIIAMVGCIALMEQM